MNKEETERIIEPFKRHGHDNPDGSKTYVCTNRTFIGDVLAKIEEQDDECGGLENKAEVDDLIELWSECVTEEEKKLDKSALSLSLQEIVEKFGWEAKKEEITYYEKDIKKRELNRKTHCHLCGQDDYSHFHTIREPCLKEPAKTLFTFLETLLP